ncbi:MAG: GAF domain-containing protein [Actinobacteria bacterium]|nr:GAF domain-containing protein [Actinomycetota bacterium]
MDFPKSADDEERISVLHSLGLLDSGADDNFDRVTRLCRRIFEVKIATISFVDEQRQWFKSVEGLDVCETDRDVAFCNYTILADDIFEVPDATADPQFSSNPLVTGAPFIRYYAGAPIRFDGKRLGALCLIDLTAHEPLDQQQRSVLRDLADIVEREIKVQRLLRESMPLLAAIIQPE